MSTPREDSGLRDMFDLVAQLPEQLTASSALPGLEQLQALPSPPRQLVLCGMGGSAIAGALLQEPLARIPQQLTVWRDYGLPGWVGAEDLVIAASYSGTTEETLSAVAAARERGCSLLAITSGGALLKAGQDESTGLFPVLRMPAGLPPRAALGLSLGALLRGLDRLGLAGDLADQLPRCAEEMRDRNAELGDPAGAVARVATSCLGRFVVIYTSGAAAHAAGERLKAQLNENSKSPASCVPFPELDHNDIVGWRLAEAERDRFVLLILRSGTESARELRRVAATADLLADDLPDQHTVIAEGSGELSRVLSLVQFGDFLSCHLAAAAEIDPMPVTRIEELKTILSKGLTP